MWQGASDAYVFPFFYKKRETRQIFQDISLAKYSKILGQSHLATVSA
jgi:hypothetical protein